MTGPLLAFYGDDFTGASAVMEVLAFAGIPTVMFLRPPTDADLARFPNLGAVGIAGIARSRDPDWMEQNLPQAFAALARFGAPVMHYKVCSTFDSAPGRGSIGKAIDIGAPLLGGAWHPMIVAAPAIRRYQAFGQLFAGTDDGVFRLDRHPVMCRHPTTPMDEADLRLHLARQTNRAIGLVDFTQIKSGHADDALAQALAKGAEVVAIDVLDDETLTEAGRLAWNDGKGPVFATGLLPASFETPKLLPVPQIFCVSGSCSPVNAAQIAAAEAHGFHVVALDAAEAVAAPAWQAALSRCLTQSLAALGNGRDVLVATARGPDDPALSRVRDAVTASGQNPGAVNDAIGAGLGFLVAEVRRRTGISRMAVAGGDTSGHAMTALGATALSARAPLAPGAPLCLVHSTTPAIDGLEVTLKGGQMGSRTFFIEAKLGHEMQRPPSSV